jgi:hypothetical protein
VFFTVAHGRISGQDLEKHANANDKKRRRHAIRETEKPEQRTPLSKTAREEEETFAASRNAFVPTADHFIANVMPTLLNAAESRVNGAFVGLPTG